jgi:hypothetical protein
MLKSLHRYLVLLMLFIGVSASSYSQIGLKASADSSRILIGQPITITLEAFVPMGETAQWIVPDSIPHFEFVNKQTPDTTGNLESKKLTQVLVLTSFDSGSWTIPEFELKVGKRSLYTDTIPVEVAFAPFDPQSDYKDIRDIIEVTNPNARIIPWIVVALAAGSLIAFILLRPKKQALTMKTTIRQNEETAFDEAMRRLRELKQKGLPEPGSEKIFYSTLNEIFRVFVNKRLEVTTAERTNEELILQLSAFGMEKNAFSKLVSALRTTDFVKFAKYQPDSVASEENWEIFRASIISLNNNHIAV